MSQTISTAKKMWMGLAVLVLLSPIGLILPDKLKAGSAWGEWGVDEIEKMLGYLPEGMKRVAGHWQAPMPDYAFKGWEKLSIGMQSLAYIVSAIIGVAVIVAIIMILGKIAAKE